MRKHTLSFVLVAVIAIGMVPVWTIADTSIPISQQVSEKASEQDIESEKEQAPPSPPPPFYRPPLRGAPEGRVGGGSRGVGDDLYTLFVFAPDHVGMTGNDQPNLYWFLSARSEHPMELTISEDQSIEPIMEITLTPPVEPGVHVWKLADNQVKLAPGHLYKWFVSIIPEAGHRSRDILAGGAIQLASSQVDLKGMADGTTGEEKIRTYAEAGLYYDAMDAVMELSILSPDNPEMDAARDSLLEQVSLPALGPMK